MAVEFKDFSINVKDALNEEAVAFLYEAILELESQTKRNVPPGGSWYTAQKNAWTHAVDEAKLEAAVGNPLEPSLWTEFGTGEHSISEKGGRKGYWVYVKDDNNIPGQTYQYTGGKAYTREEAKKVVTMMRSKGLDAHYTNGQEPKRPLHNAFVHLKPAIIKEAQARFKERFRS